MDTLNNKKKKLLTVEDLVKFCENQQLTTFSSKESGYQLCVQVPAIFKKKEVKTEVEDNTLLYCILKTCHIGLNRNGSYISEESMKAAMPTLKYKPILCNFTDTEDGKDFTSHDMEIDKDGNIDYIERQVGCFTSDEPYLEYDEENDKTYVMAYAAIPRDYTEAANIIERKDGTKVSVELSINEMSFNSKEKYLQLDSFVFSGCTLLGVDPDTGKEVGEGMEGARLDIADFSQENNSIINYSEENKDIDKLIETLEALNNTLSKININQAEFSANETLEEGGTKDVDNAKFLELLEKYNKTEADIEFEIEGLSDEELETKFAEVFGEEAEENPASEEGDEFEGSEENKDEIEEQEDNTEGEENNSEDEEGSEESEDIKNNDDSNDEGNDDVESEVDTYSSVVKYSVESKGKTKTYEVSLDEKIYAIQDLVNITYGESDNTYYGVKVYEDYVIMLDYWSGRAYKQSYSEEDDLYTLTGDRVEVYSVWVTKEEEAALEEMKSNYSYISEQLSKYQDAEIKAQKEEVLSDNAYVEFAETNEFKAIVKEMDSLTVEELRTKCELAFAKLVKAKGTFAIKEETKTQKKTNKIGINVNFEESEDNEPYGDYFKSLNA